MKEKFKKDLAIGLEAEALLQSLALSYAWMGERAVEVKNDREVSDTGNIFVECEYRGQPSGIATSRSPWWAFVFNGERYNREIIVFIEVNRLRSLCQGYPTVSGGDHGWSRGYLIPASDLVSGLFGGDP